MFRSSSSSRKDSKQDLDQFTTAFNESVPPQEKVVPVAPAVNFQDVAEKTYHVIVHKENTAAIGYDLPRLLARIDVNGQIIDREKTMIHNERISQFLKLLYCEVCQKDLLGSEEEDDVLQSIRQLIAEAENSVKESNLNKTIELIFTRNHPVFQILRSFHQNAIAHPIMFLKNVFKQEFNESFKDERWRVHILIDNNIETDEQTTRVIHERKERVQAIQGNDYVTWFIFNWQCELLFHRILSSSEQSLSHLVSIELKFLGIESYNENVDATQRVSEESAQAAIRTAFEKYSSKVSFLDHQENTPDKLNE